MVKVAVNIVTFNSAREIAACLDSLQKQTFQNIGIHIFDNASSDDTLKVVSSFDIDYLKHSSVNTGFCQAHNDLVRGADQIDEGQFESAEDIFGASGAAALFRRTALDDVAIGDQYFDEDFFAYREDADLAWRCRLLGWNSIYVPSAIARHRRFVTPERRDQLPKEINYHSVKNRFLLRINNMSGNMYWRHFWSITKREAAVVGYVLLRERSSIPGL